MKSFGTRYRRPPKLQRDSEEFSQALRLPGLMTLRSNLEEQNHVGTFGADGGTGRLCGPKHQRDLFARLHQ
jgi:hypothetical protein